VEYDRAFTQLGFVLRVGFVIAMTLVPVEQGYHVLNKISVAQQTCV
jgi:hypothetical protein